jgi:hypothetical protein
MEIMTNINLKDQFNEVHYIFIERTVYAALNYHFEADHPSIKNSG